MNKTYCRWWSRKLHVWRTLLNVDLTNIIDEDINKPDIHLTVFICQECGALRGHRIRGLAGEERP